MSGPLRVLVRGLGENVWLIGFDVAAVWDLADGRMHHAALTMLALLLFNLVAGISFTSRDP